MAEVILGRQIVVERTPNQIRDDEAAMQRNNPRGERTGPFTGRCGFCGSSDLWDDNLAYGCKSCGRQLGGNA